MGERDEKSGYELPEFPYVRPADLDGPLRRVPLVIVGGGLAGLTLAADLSVRGVPFILLDEDNTVGVRGAASQGIVYAQRSLEIFDRLGIFERLAQKGVRWSVGRSLRGKDEIIYQFDAAEQSVSAQPPFLNIQQFYIEWYLIDRIMELGVGEVRWRNRLVQAQQQGDHVSLEIETPDGVYMLEADWVADCSGLASRLRASLGIKAESEKGTERWCISDVRFAVERPLERWTWVESPVNDGRAVWQHPMADGVWRIDFQMELDADVEYISRADVCTDRVKRLLGEDVEFELVWVGPWASRTHLLDSFRHGRVLFAGDSAHVFPPLGARGGNSGIQDADNLGWKLALVLQGRAPESLLDSYTAERRPAAIHNTELATRSVRFLSPVSPGQRRLRKAAMDLARRCPFATSLINTGRMSSAFSYEASPLNPGYGRPLSNVQLPLPQGRSSLVAQLRGHTDLLALVGEQAVLPVLPEQVKILRIGKTTQCDVHDIGGEVVRAVDLGPDEIMIVRPDLHVLIQCASHEQDRLEEALARVLSTEESHS